MNLTQLLSDRPSVERLGSTLLHFVWQGILIAALYAVARKRTSGARSNLRYALACAALALMAAAPLLTWIAMGPPQAQPTAASFAAPLSAGAHPDVRDIPTTASGEPLQRSPYLAWVAAVWFGGVIAFALRLTGGWIFTRRLRTQTVRPAPPEWQQAVDALKTRVRLSRPVRLLVSSMIQVPTVIGWLRPIVLVPAGALAGLPAAQLEALLLHELAHIRRHDYLVNVVQSLVEALLFYHPAVWWISRQIRTERELCCDDLAVSVTGDVLTYARALSEFAAATIPRLNTVVAANGGALTHRIARLAGESRPAPGDVSGSSALAAGILLGIAGLAGFAQTPERPQFEAASVKPSPETSFMRVRPLPGRLTATASLRLLMQNAYALQPFQIVGAPAWADSDRFEVDAKASNNADRARIFLMLQSLLEERFHLRVHRETKEQPVYALVAARSGLKLANPKEGACEEPSPNAQPEWVGGRMQPPGQGRAPLPVCGSVAVRLDPSGARMDGGKVPMSELTRILSMVMGRAVIDRTGHAGLFDVHLAFLPDQSSAALPPPPPDSAAAQDPRFPSIVTALQEQLGLRVESARGPVDVLVIDRVEKPSAN